MRGSLSQNRKRRVFSPEVSLSRAKAKADVNFFIEMKACRSLWKSLEDLR